MTLVLAPSIASAQRGTRPAGPCGDVTSFSDEDQTFFVAPMFVDAEQGEVRRDLGIVQQPAGTVAVTVKDERLCRTLAHLVREALQTPNPWGLRFDDVVPTYVRVGRYFYVALGLQHPLPAGTDARLPVVIIDGSTMTVVRVVLG